MTNKADTPDGAAFGRRGGQAVKGESTADVTSLPGLDVFDPTRPHPARIYNYWVGGKDNFETDRRIAEQIAAVAPWVIAGARGNRAFLTRAVSYLAREGVDQFLDVGTGLPCAGNVHEVAQRINPRARTVYVDHDEIVLAHARALLATDARTIVVGGDARNPKAILRDATVRGHLDLSRPVAVLFLAVLHFIGPDDTDISPAQITAAVRDALTPGSYLAVSHVADLPDLERHRERAEATREAARLYDALAAPFSLRTCEQIHDLFEGFELVPPGIVPAHLWRPGHGRPGPSIPVLAGIGRLPTPGSGPQPDPAREPGAASPDGQS